ncbi:uncharacterized protein LOC116515388 isoform X2 [Thamnophis elegans]|uniref:uncharacterized protein LOC116515388 isoform X2 n=1 Tax=Thamnophis elegans TaxID=35005 RepID=UPI001377E23D|nr:uncharacterized protein LOC116515388 isoform X2 [Thamnophis elegans]
MEGRPVGGAARAGRAPGAGAPPAVLLRGGRALRGAEAGAAALPLRTAGLAGALPAGAPRGAPLRRQRPRPLHPRFSPDLLGLLGSSALAWLIVEVLAVLLGLYLAAVHTALTPIDLVVFSGYKYVGMVAGLLAGLVFGKPGYYMLLGWCCVAIFVFTIRSLRLKILSEATERVSRRDTQSQEDEMPDEVNIDDLLEMDTDEERAKKLQGTLESCHNNTEDFTRELLEKLRGLRTEHVLRRTSPSSQRNMDQGPKVPP